MLFVIATPIGNLADLSQRAVTALKESDLILCEDTRHSLVLLRHYQIEKPLLSFHQFNEKSMEERVLQQLEEGHSIALISDAGTPLISDPGISLIQACIQKNLPFTAIPGPCSVIQALLLSGFDTDRFQFVGFLPRKDQALQRVLRQALYYQGTTIAFESPERLVNTLELLEQLAPLRTIAVARELTKLHEECRRGAVQDLLAHFRSTAPRGEIVLLIQKGEVPELELDLEELVKLLQELQGLSLKEAIKTAASLKGVPKNQLYKIIHHLDQGDR